MAKQKVRDAIRRERKDAEQTSEDPLRHPPIQMKALAPPGGIEGGEEKVEEGRSPFLPKELRNKMKKAFGNKFSEVKVEPKWDQAEEIDAKAMTKGKNIYFSPGSFDPQSADGQKIIGKHFAHIVQQDQGRVSATDTIKGHAINKDSQLDAEAQIAGELAAQGQKVTPSLYGLDSGAVTSVGQLTEEDERESKGRNENRQGPQPIKQYLDNKYFDQGHPDFGLKFVRHRVSWKMRREDNYRQKGSSRPTFYANVTKPDVAVDVKSPNLKDAPGLKRVYRTIRKQYSERKTNLRPDTQQQFVFDITGQPYDDSILNQIRAEMKSILGSNYLDSGRPETEFYFWDGYQLF